MSGRIEVICGPMFAGKTEELQRRIRRAVIGRQRALVLKPTIDTRREGVVSHADRELSEATVRVVDPTIPREWIEDAIAFDVVAFDEAQFFDHRIEVVTRQLALDHRVIVAGLDTDSRGEPFGPMPRLMALADEVTKLSAVCVRCGRDASRTYRTARGQAGTVWIGAQESYEARCRPCFEEAVNRD